MYILSKERSPPMTTEQPSREALVLTQLSAIYPASEAFYTGLHEHPELSMQEVQTAAKVASRLQAAGLEVSSGGGGTGVGGLLRNGAGSTVMLGGDMDALPLERREDGLPLCQHRESEEPRR
jgi:hippurate hydrolase